MHVVARARTPPDPGPGGVRFLAQGRVRCAVHERLYAARRPRSHEGPGHLFCNGGDLRLRRDRLDCAYAAIDQVERALCRLFAEQLTLDEEDVRELARLAERRRREHGGREARLRRERGECAARLARAMDLALREEHAPLREELMAEALRAKRALADLEAELAGLAAAHAPSPAAWIAPQRATALAERIRATFLEWSRAAQARVLALALDDAVLGYIDRQRLGLWVRWQGARESRVELAPRCGKHLEWTEAEKEVVRRYYPTHSYEALGLMLPSRTVKAIRKCASTLGVERSQAGRFEDLVTCVVRGPAVANTMAAYGFPSGQERGSAGEQWGEQQVGAMTFSGRAS